MTKFTIAFPLLLATVASAEHAWYPDWSNGSGTCLDDVANPSTNTWLTIPANGYLVSTLVACCARYYSGVGNYNACITGGGGTVVGSNKYYPAWDQSPHTCAKDCAESTTDPSCGGLLGPGVSTAYDSAELCCAKHFGSQTEAFCVAQTNGVPYGGSGKWYLDASENICAKDCATGTSCGGVVIGSWQTLYSDIAACCAAKLPSLDAAFCAGQSSPTASAGATSTTAAADLAAAYTSALSAATASVGVTVAVGNGKWYADYSVSPARCVQNCAKVANGNPACAGVVETTAGVTFFDSPDTCCDSKFGWYDKTMCTQLSAYGGSAATMKWYVSYGSSNCVRDCPPFAAHPECKGNPENFGEKLFLTVEKCCAAKLNWIDAAVCAGASAGTSAGAAVPATAATGTNKWLVDYNGKKCVQGIVEAKPGLSLYDTMADCCANKLSYITTDLCHARSDGGDGHSGKYYPVTGEDVCKMDCPASLGAPCAGAPSDLSAPLYTTPEACCSGSLGWVDAESCHHLSIIGSAAATNRWLGNYNDKKCVKDCATESGAGCAGIVENKAGLQTFSTLDDCCTKTLGYITKELCIARSDGGDGHSGKYYPTQPENVCKMDCPASLGSPCAGAPSDLSTPVYDDPETCCTSSIKWEDSTSCQQMTMNSSNLSVTGTGKWYVDWTTSQCVKDCATGTGASSQCGGLMETWDVSFATPETCCVQLSWKPLAECTKS